jgi:myosin-1
MPHLEQEVGSWDSVLLDNLSEDSFINNLHQRYKRDHIYVRIRFPISDKIDNFNPFVRFQSYIGTFLVALNPYKPLSIYTPDLVEAYATKSLFQLPPNM